MHLAGADVSLHCDSPQPARAQMIHQRGHTASPQGQSSAVPNCSILCSQSKYELLCPWSSSSCFHSRSEMCSLAQSAVLQKKEECLITISTNHVLGVKGLEVREGKGKKPENSLICADWLKNKYKMEEGKASANLILLCWNGPGLTLWDRKWYVKDH